MKKTSALLIVTAIFLLPGLALLTITGCAGGAVPSPSAELSKEEIFGPTELHYLKEALRCIKMTPQDLLYSKNKSPDLPYRLKSVDYLMANPVQVPFYTDQLARDIYASESNLPALLNRLLLELDLSLPPARFIEPLASDKLLTDMIDMKYFPEFIRQTDNLHQNLKDALVILLAGMYQSNILINEAFDNLSPECEKNVSEHGGDFDIYEGYDSVSRGHLLSAGVLMTEALELAMEKLDNIRKQKGKPAKEFGLSEETVKGDILFYARTVVGEIIIGGSGPNEYHRDFSLIIDVGGDDKYSCRAGGLDARIQPPVAVCIDLDGNNEFIARMPAAEEVSKPKEANESDRLPPAEKRISFCQGAALCGVGILVVKGNGDNTFVAGDWSQGASHLGIGILKRIGKGNDSYKALDCSQGAACFGVGILQDEKGDDKYRATFASQGFGAEAGVGLLQDKSGNDNYYAGGRYEDYPQRPKGSFIAMSQGFGYGLRPHCSGGIGILNDRAGNDFYHLDNQFGIGGSYWYGYGVFVDDAGNDIYQTGKPGDYDGYTMGAAIHLTVACMIDRAGNDKYIANRIGPAVGWDLSPGWLVDCGGDDVFTSDKNWNWGFGAGVQNGCGFLVKKSGKMKIDGYSYPAGQIERDCGSIGILLNLGGDGEYTGITPLMKANLWVSGNGWEQYQTWSAGIDIKPPKKSGLEESVNEWPAAEPRPKIPDETAPTLEEFKRIPADIHSNAINFARELVLQGTVYNDEIMASQALTLLLDKWTQDPYDPYLNYELAAMYAYWDPESALNHLRFAAENGYSELNKFREDIRFRCLYLPPEISPDATAPPIDYSPQLMEIEQHFERNSVDLNKEHLNVLWEDCVKEQGAHWEKSSTARDLFKSFGRPAVHYALSKLNSENYYEYAWANQLIKSAGTKAVPLLLAYLKIKDKPTKRNVILLLGQIGPVPWIARDSTEAPNVVDEIMLFLMHPDYRDITIVSLGQLKDSRAVPMLLSLQHTPPFIESESLRKLLAVSLGNIADPMAVPNLITLLDDPYFWVRYPAEKALIQIGEPAVIPLIEKARQGLFPSSAHAIEALGRIKDTRAYDVLAELTTHPDWAIRACAAETLGNLGDAKTKALVENMKKQEKHPFVISKINQTLLK